MYYKDLPSAGSISTALADHFDHSHTYSSILPLMSMFRDPRSLLFDLIDERCTEHEDSEWCRTQAAVKDGRISRRELLEALDWAVWRFSAILTSKLHDNLMADLKIVDAIMTGDIQCWMSFHQEWTWKLLHLPHLVAMLKIHENEILFLGIKELVGDRRAANMGLIRYMTNLSDRGSQGPV